MSLRALTRQYQLTSPESLPRKVLHDVDSTLYDASCISYVAAGATPRKGKKSGWSQRVSRPKINPSWSFVTYQRYPSMLSTELLSSRILQYDIPTSIFLHISSKVSRSFWLFDRIRTRFLLSRDIFHIRRWHYIFTFSVKYLCTHTRGIFYYNWFI